jgi:hypothetical protein
MQFFSDIRDDLRRRARESPALRRVHTGLIQGRQDVLLRLAGRRSWPGGMSSVGVDPARMVWIFGSGRSGSTWLRSMMAEMGGHRVWEEPMVGKLFGEFYSRAPKENLRSANFIMGDPIRRGWVISIRNFVLDGARYSNPRLGAEEYLVVKEPNGSMGAPLLMEALPESRMILLVRDPRDVVASVFDAARDGGWLNEQSERESSGRQALADRKPDLFVKRRAKVYLQSVSGARRAYDAHRGPKVLIRYEDLRAQTLGEMRRVYSELAVPADDAELERAVEKHSWERLPEREKGRGKARRKARPGSWTEDLTEEQVVAVERVTAPILEMFYPELGRDRRFGEPP